MNTANLNALSLFTRCRYNAVSWNVHSLLVKCISWFKESKHTHRNSFASITNAVASLQCISSFKESKHTHRSSFANITNAVASLQCISWFKDSKHTHRSSLANITNAVPSLQCTSWFKESKHPHRSSAVTPLKLKLSHFSFDMGYFLFFRIKMHYDDLLLAFIKQWLYSFIMVGNTSIHLTVLTRSIQLKAVSTNSAVCLWTGALYRRRWDIA